MIAAVYCRRRPTELKLNASVSNSKVLAEHLGPRKPGKPMCSSWLQGTPDTPCRHKRAWPLRGPGNMALAGGSYIKCGTDQFATDALYGASLRYVNETLRPQIFL